MKLLLVPAVVLGLLASVGTAQSAPLANNVGQLAQATLAAQQVDKIGWRRHHGWHKHRWHRRWHRRHHGWWGYPRRHYGWWGHRRHHYWR
jgi:hypothetical protein